MFDPIYGWLALITLGAATVNGGLGYGFSSITVPLALLFTTSRILNPALVLVEVVLNLYALSVNRASAGVAMRRVWPIVLGLAPGVLVGSLIVASVNPDIVKLITYIAIIPLILVQAAGLRRPIPREQAIGAPFGAGLGLLYSVTTISGPPLALLFNNQGYAKRDFRAALAVVRVAESSMTAISYLFLGLITPASLGLIPAILPSVLIGIPLGAAIIRRVDVETFRRICMSFDAWIVSLGLSRVLEGLGYARGTGAYLVMAIVVTIDIVLLSRFFAVRSAAIRAGTWAAVPSVATGDAH